MTNNISKILELDCVGCKSCFLSCKFNAITMKESDEGFFYPIINEKCVSCGICLSKCPVNINEKNSIISLYACTNKNDKKLKTSTSGGMFIELASYVLQKQGKVIGCIFDENMYPKHIIADSLEQVEHMKGSRYVESDLGDTYLQAEKELKAGINLLFIGTPCQIAGLKTYLGKDYENLLAVDLLCYGVPSRKLFLNHIKYIERKFNRKIVDCAFRDKRSGGNYCGTRTKYVFANGKKVIIEIGSDPYYSSFFKAETFKESCYHCKFVKNGKSDITIGDFWGLKDIYPDLNFEKGISSCYIHTEKGADVFNKIYANLNVIDCTNFLEDIVNKESNHIRPNKRDSIYHNLDDNNYFEKFNIQKYSFFYYLKRNIRLMIPDSMIYLLRKVIKRRNR